MDNIDLQAATRKGVVVMNAPGGNSLSVAEHTISLLLSLARSIADASQRTRAGKWEKKKYASGRELSGKTLGVVGTGNIGGSSNAACARPLLIASARSNLRKT